MAATVTPLPRRRRGRLAAAQPRLAGITVARAAGAWVWDEAGRAHLDLTSGGATLDLGHGHPRVTAAARDQMDELLHCGGAFGHARGIELAERLGGIAPGRTRRGAPRDDGRRGERARPADRPPGHRAGRGGGVPGRLPRPHRRRPRLLDQPRGPARRRRGGPVATAPFPRPAAWGGDAEAAARAALAALGELHRHDLAPDDTAAYLVEPVQGHGGCHPGGRRFLEGLRERADRHGALLVFDEVQTGMGRTGDGSPPGPMACGPTS